MFFTYKNLHYLPKRNQIFFISVITFDFFEVFVSDIKLLHDGFSKIASKYSYMKHSSRSFGFQVIERQKLNF